MVCNVCGAETRCYTLQELTMSPMRMDGMVFRICTDCLSKLIKAISTDKTFLDNPDDYPIRESVLRRIDHVEQRRNAQLLGKHPIKVTV